MSGLVVPDNNPSGSSLEYQLALIYNSLGNVSWFWNNLIEKMNRTSIFLIKI